jgi:hypothetical protein
VIDNLILLGIIQKHAEGDGGRGAGGEAPYLGEYCPDCDVGDEVVDEDRDIYFLAFVYKGEGWDGGLLYGYNRNYHSNPDLDITDHNFVPYLRGTFGPLKVEGELWYVTGELEPSAHGADDTDVDAWAAHGNVGFDVGPVGLSLGLAYTSGDDDPLDNDKENFLRSGGQDWTPLLIMTGYYMDSNLGCMGNLNMRNVYTSTGSGLDRNVLGYTLYYATADWSPMENVVLDFALGYAQINEEDHLEYFEGYTGLDDEFGWEFDIGLTWQLMDNLKYNAKFGYFSEGDFWEMGDCNIDRDNTYSFLHALTVTF